MRAPLDPRILFPDGLPITAHVQELADAIAAHPVVIVAGETGSGKTTQLPKLCRAMGRTRIGCTQPRRLAATSVAARVAHELGGQLGDEVGYKVRFSDKLRATTAIKFMTDGMLLAEIQGDARLGAYDTIIIDEAHERSLNIDFLLGFCKRLVARRADLRIIISSATLELERFARFFDGAPVIQVSGRTFPVDVIYRPPREDEVDLSDLVANTVNEITELDPRPDVLVFLPGEREIREAQAELEQRALPHTELLPLYARLSVAEQARVFQPGGKRRVILATNVAETSLTIPGIVYVVDPGLARINRYDVKTGVSQLHVEEISQASANQRKGRCGRVQNGICFRLYEEPDFLSRPAFTDPEIKRVGLAGVILRMLSLRLGDIAEFPFIDPPSPRAIGEGYRVLEELGAIDDRRDLTKLGAQLARLPLDPRLARMIMGGVDEGALREVVVIAAGLGLRDPRDRPQAEAARADEAHRAFREEGSDFAALLKLWAAWRDARDRLTRRQLQKFCRDRFLSYVRMREWEDIHDQIVRVLKDEGLAPNATPASGEQLHRALLPGLLSRIGMFHPESRSYMGPRQTRFVIHPSSALSKKPPAWIMAAELVETSQLFARTVAKLDPAWIEAVAGDLCRKSHFEPHWAERAGQAMTREQVTLFGLPIVKARTTALAPYDPALARELFITHALCRGEYVSKGTFAAHNAKVMAEAETLRDKARRSDMFVDEHEVYAFFERVLPPGIVNGKTFEDWRRVAEAKQPAILHLDRDDVLGDQRELTPARYPEALTFGGIALPLTYRFDPGADDDGITIAVPLAILPQLDPAVMAWTIPGWHRTLIEALLDSLPKAQRRALSQASEARDSDVIGTGAKVAELSEIVAVQLKPFDGPMLAALERALYTLTRERVQSSQWDWRAVPEYLRFRFTVIEHDKVIDVGRDLGELQTRHGGRAREVWQAAPRDRLERRGLRAWDFEALPVRATLEVAGKKVQAYPALVDVGDAVDIRLLESEAAATAAMRGGLRRLFALGAQTPTTRLEGLLPGAVPKAMRVDVVRRALDTAFALDQPADTWPRDKLAFKARLAGGAPDVLGLVDELGSLAGELATQAAVIRTALKPWIGKPGPIKVFVDDVQSQLAQLLPDDVWQHRSLARLADTRRYLQAIRVRLQRHAVDPAKDAAKAAPLLPLWQGYLARAAKLTTPNDELDDFRWMLEELRVSIFAPEVGAAQPVSIARAQARWAGTGSTP